MLRFSSAETLIFILLLAASGFGFWRRFGRVLRTIRIAKPDRDFQIAPLGPRFRDFVWEVMLQAKVIRERPWTGLAHAFVFWGFCAFALVTLNHLAAALRMSASIESCLPPSQMDWFPPESGSSCLRRPGSSSSGTDRNTPIP